MSTFQNVESKARILVTGATGFVGQFLLKEMSAKYDIDIVSRSSSNTEAIRGHFINSYRWDELEHEKTEYKAIIHLAGLAHDTRSEQALDQYMKVNLGLTSKIGQYAQHSNSGTLIYLSSIKAAGEHKGVYTEDLPSKPSDPYGQSKLAAEEWLSEQESDFQYVALRPSLIYGPNFKGNLTKLSGLIDRGLPYPFANYDNARTMLYIGNLLAVIEEIIEKGVKSGVYQVCDDEPVSTLKLMEHIAKARKNKLRKFAIPNSWVKPFMKPGSKGIISRFLIKMLGNLELSNRKLLEALKWENMPYKTEDSLIKSFKSD